MVNHLAMASSIKSGGTVQKSAKVPLPFIEKFLVTNWVTTVPLFDPFRSFNLFLEAAVLRSRCLLLVSLRAFRNSSFSSLFGKPFETRLPTTSSAVLLVLKLTVPDDD